jgi:hypothetical protein
MSKQIVDCLQFILNKLVLEAADLLQQVGVVVELIV